MALKITLIGAGSVVFAKNLIGDILQFPELSDATLCLMDIDASRLKVAEIMANRMVTALGVKAKVIATRDRRAAIRGARYVICTVQVGGYKPGTVIDFEIPRKYGLLQTIGDTLGVGGVFRALRTIPVLVEIARDIAEVGAPGCILLNYTNPMAMNCMAVARATGIPHVGLCHSVQGTAQQLGQYLGLPFTEITYLAAGINHMAFFLKYEFRGQDAYPLLFQLLSRPDFKQDLVRFEMMRRTGYFVTESSEHQSEYVPYFIHHGQDVMEKFQVPIDEYLRRCESIIKTWKKTEAELLGDNGTMKVQPQTHEYGSFIIHSRETHTPRVIYGNVPNIGLIENLPREACVEVPCLVDAQGIQPTHIGVLPPQLAALCQTNINVQVLAVEAALTGKREHIYHAVMLDPHTATVLTLDKIWAMCDDLIAAHQKHGLLGSFAPTISGTGRSYAGTGDRIFADVEPDLRKASDREKFHGEIVLHNPRPKPFFADLEVACVNNGSNSPVDRCLNLKVRVPAGRTIRKKISLALSKEDTEKYVVRISSGSPEIFARDYVVYQRRSLFAGSKEGAPFEAKLAGNPAVEGSIAIGRNTIAVRFAVDDSNILPGENPWDGSCVELFFSPDNAKDLPITQIFIIPQAGGRRVKVVDREFKRMASVRARIGPRSHGSGYEVNAEIPFASVGIPPGHTSLLFNATVHINALGTAHSGGRVSLSGEFDSWCNSKHFFLVETKSK